MKKTIKTLTIFIFLFIVIVFYFGLSKDKDYSTKNLIGKKLTPISIYNFQNDEILNINQLKNYDYTLINFWASWCSPCRKEHPLLMKLSNEKKLFILGINFKDNKKNAIKFLNQLGNPYNYIAKDKLGKNSVMFGIYGIPESILIDKELIIKKKYTGPISKVDFEEILNFIN